MAAIMTQNSASHICTARCADGSKKTLLRYGEYIAAQKGQRWTAPRAAVYEAVLDARRPATAYQLLEALCAKDGTDVKPATVYRALDALQELGLVARIESMNAYLACRHPQQPHEHIFLVCDDCGDAAEVADHKIAGHLRHDAASHGFKTARQVMELHGTCQHCQK